MNIAARDGQRKRIVLSESDLDALPSPKRKLARNLVSLLEQLVAGPDRCRIVTPDDVALQCMDLLLKEQEHFVLLLLNSKQFLIRRGLVSIGTIDAALVHPRDVFRIAIEANAAAVVCVHNHPSGDPTPSPEDIALTQRLIKAGEIIGIDVMDHVIVGRNGWRSLNQEGLI